MTVFFQFNFVCAFIVIVLFNLFIFSCSNEFCSKTDGTCSNEFNENLGKNKYQDDFASKIISKINFAESNYKNCPYSNCSCFFKTLKNDLKPFKNGITREMIDSIRSRGTTYIIYEKRLYRDKDCLFPSRCSGIEYFIKKIISHLKNTELIINTRDWPQISRHFKLFGPVFSFSKTQDYLDIMYPAWSFWEGGPAIKTYPTGLGRWDLHRKKLSEESSKWPWNKKKSIG